MSQTINNIFIFSFILFSLEIFSQQKDFTETRKFDTLIFNEGIYLTYEDLLKNSPLPFNDTIEIKKEILKYKNKEGDTFKISLRNTWGKVEDRQIFIYWGYTWTNMEKNGEGSYHRIFYIAPIMPLFVYNLIKREVLPGSDYNPASGTYMPYSNVDDFLFGGPNVKYREQKKTLYVSFKDGKPYSFNKKNILQYIKMDEELYKEYENSKLKKRDKLLLFTKKYNDRHPIKLELNK